MNNSDELSNIQKLISLEFPSKDIKIIHKYKGDFNNAAYSVELPDKSIGVLKLSGANSHLLGGGSLALEINNTALANSESKYRFSPQIINIGENKSSYI